MHCLKLQQDDPVSFPTDSTSLGKDDVIDLENPADLLTALLSQLGGTASISKLCKVCMYVCMYVCTLLSQNMKVYYLCLYPESARSNWCDMEQEI